MDALSYIDKLAYLSDCSESTLALPKISLGEFSKLHTNRLEAVSKAILSIYSKQRKQAIRKIKLRNQRRFSALVPFFLETAIRQTRDNDRQALFNTIADLHNHVAGKFRELGRRIKIAPYNELIEIQNDIEKLFRDLVKEGKSIPDLSLKSVFNLITFIPAFLEGWTKILEKAKDLSEIVGQTNQNQLYHGLSIINQIHKRDTNNFETFYQELSRVCGELDFNQVELEEYFLANTPEI